MAVPFSWFQYVSPNIKMLLFIMISMVVRKNSVGKDGLIDALCCARSFESASIPIVGSMFEYMDEASAVNSSAPGGSFRVQSC